MPINYQAGGIDTSNARHRPPRRMIADEGRAVRGRVHAFVGPRLIRDASSYP
jgi:hypothetical protein